MASIDDILSAILNTNKTLSSWVSAQKRALGNLTTALITAPTLVITGSGRLVSMTVIVGGSAGAIYNSATVAAAVAANELAVIPTTVGVVQLGMEFNAGLVVSPGSGQTCVITYYSGP